MYILKYHGSRLHSKKITNMHPKIAIQLETQYKCYMIKNYEKNIKDLLGQSKLHVTFIFEMFICVCISLICLSLEGKSHIQRLMCILDLE
jgi:hypothetical protein